MVPVIKCSNDLNLLEAVTYVAVLYGSGVDIPNIYETITHVAVIIDSCVVVNPSRVI